MAIKELEKKFVSAVVYVHNHSLVLNSFIEILIDQLKSHFEDFELIFVDDCSIDNSVDVIKEVIKKENVKAISIIHLSYYQGIEVAMVAGVDLAIGDFVFEFDSPYVDYRPEDIMNIYDQSLRGYDLVSASPNKQARWFSKFFYKTFSMYSRNKIQLTTERFRIISRRGINRINVLSSTIPYRKAIYFNSGLKASVYKYDAIILGTASEVENSLNTTERVSLAIDSLLLFTDIGTRVALYMTLFMIALTVIGALYTVLIFLFNQRVVEGWTTTMLFMSVSFSGLFLLIGIVIKYASMILYMQNKKQTYIIESIEKL